MLTPLLCFVVLASSTMIDFAHARCIVAINDRAAHRAAKWSIVQWGGATIGFIIAIKVTLLVLPFEAAGLYIGTVLAVPRQRPAHRSPKTLADALSQRIDVEPVLAAISSTSIDRTWS